MLLVVVAGALVIAGAVVGVGTVVRRGVGSPLEADPTAVRVAVEVHAGEEQVLIHLARVLGLPTGREDVGYGQLYIAGSAGSTMKLASRSEIGRGFDGEVRVHRTRRASVAEYVVLRLPGDESVQRRIAALDQELVTALRDLDPQAVVRQQPGRRGTLRGFEPTTR